MDYGGPEVKWWHWLLGGVVLVAMYGGFGDGGTGRIEIFDEAKQEVVTVEVKPEAKPKKHVPMTEVIRHANRMMERARIAQEGY